MNECPDHKAKYTKFCESCKKFLCTQCLEDHIKIHSQNIISLEIYYEISKNNTDYYKNNIFQIKSTKLPNLIDILFKSKNEIFIVKISDPVSLSEKISIQKRKIDEFSQKINDLYEKINQSYKSFDSLEKFIENHEKLNFSFDLISEYNLLESEILIFVGELYKKSLENCNNELNEKKEILTKTQEEILLNNKLLSEKLQPEISMANAMLEKLSAGLAEIREKIASEELKNQDFKNLETQKSQISSEIIKKQQEINEMNEKLKNMQEKQENLQKTINGLEENLIKVKKDRDLWIGNNFSEMEKLKKEKHILEQEIENLKQELKKTKEENKTKENAIKNEEKPKLIEEQKQILQNSPEISKEIPKDIQNEIKKEETIKKPENKEISMPFGDLVENEKNVKQTNIEARSGSVIHPQTENSNKMQRNTIMAPKNEIFNKNYMLNISPTKRTEEVKHLIKTDITQIKKSSEKVALLEQPMCACCSDSKKFKPILTLFCGHKICQNCTENFRNRSENSQNIKCLWCGIFVPPKSAILSCGCNTEFGELRYFGLGEIRNFRYTLNELKDDFSNQICKNGHALTINDLKLIHGNSALTFMIHHVHKEFLNNLSKTKIKDISKNELRIELKNALVTIEEFKEFEKFIKANESKIKSLDLGRNRLSDEIMKIVGEMIANMKNIEELNLQDNQLGDKSFEFLAEGLMKNKSIKILDLKANNLSKIGLKAIENILKTNQGIININLAFNNLSVGGSEFIGNALKKNTILQEINLDKNNLTDKGIALLIPALKLNKTVKILHLENNEISGNGFKIFAENSKQLSGLKELYLKQNKLDKNAAKPLGIFISQCQSLILFDISYNNLTEECWEQFAEGMQFNKTLRILNVSGNILKDQGLISFGKILKTNTMLKKLIMEDVTIGGDGVKQFCNSLSFNNSLSELILSKNILTDESAKCLSLGLQLSPSLVKFHIGGCRLTEIGTKHFFAAARNKDNLSDFRISEATINAALYRDLSDIILSNKSLISLNLQHSSLGPEGALQLANSIKSSKLEILELKECDIKNQGALSIFQALAKNGILKSLDIRKNDLTDIVAEYIENCLLTNITLMKIDLSKNKIKEFGLDLLARIKKANSYIDIIFIKTT